MPMERAAGLSLPRLRLPNWSHRTHWSGSLPLHRAIAGALAVIVALGFVAGTASAQDGGIPTPADAGQSRVETIPASAWLLPFQSMFRWPPEPVSWVIALCSVVAVTLIIQAFIRVRRGSILPEESHAQIEQMIQQKQFRELVEFTQTDDSFVSRSLNPSLKRAPNFVEMREALEAGVAEETAEHFRKLEYINILANVGPLLGLLGTVIGIMDAFLEMRKAGGTADVSALAGGISTALGTTMMGLTLAIPCLTAYGVLRNKADRLTQEGAMLSEEFLLMMRADGRPAPGRQAPQRPQPMPAPRDTAPGSAPGSLPAPVPAASSVPNR